MEKAVHEAGKVFGTDPAYFGEEGEKEIERQLNKLGYSIEDFTKNSVVLGAERVWKTLCLLKIKASLKKNNELFIKYYYEWDLFYLTQVVSARIR